MPQRILGIDIGSYSVKAALVERSFRSFQFVGFYERRIQYNDLLSAEESIGIAIQGLIDDQHLSWDMAVAGFPTQRVASRLLTFPFSGTKKIEQALTFEIESYIPFEPDQIVLDYAVLHTTKESSKALVVYVQKGDFVKTLTMLQGVGIDPRAICVEGVEFANLLGLGLVPPEGGYAILDIGHEKTNITVCHGRHVGFVRAISIAGKTITEAISKKLGVPYDEAEKMKIEMGSLGGESDAEMDEITKGVVSSLQGVLSELLLHVRQTLFTYRDEEGVSVDGVYLSGGTSRLPGIDRYISDVLKLNVTHINPAEFHFSHLERVEGHRHVVGQALAFALNGVASGGAPDINLRQKEFSFKGDVEQFGGNMRHAAIAVGVILALACGSFAVRYYSLKGKLTDVEEEVQMLVRQALPDVPEKSIKTTTGALSLLKSRQAEIGERVQELTALSESSPLDVLREISTLAPARSEVVLDVNKLTIATDRILMSGSTDSFESVDRMKFALEGSPLFENVTSGNVHKGTKGEVKFDLTMDIVGRKEEK